MITYNYRFNQYLLFPLLVSPRLTFCTQPHWPST